MGKAKQIELPKKVLREPLQRKAVATVAGDNPLAKLMIANMVDESNQPKQRYDEVLLSLIRVSNTVPQKIRRLGFTDENLKDITESVRQNGVLEPILLRPIVKNGLITGYELAAGERRFLAADRAGLTEIPAIIKELTDEGIDDIQLHENLHREEPHPLEEAATYDYMEKERGFALEEIAARAAKSIRYVAGRKELLKLNENVKNIFRKNELTLSHALEISKYPEADQDEILSYAFSNFGHTSQALYPMFRFNEAIEQHYLLQLSKAPFSLKSNELRSDGLACVNCPERTGAKPLLFGEEVDKKDACLNRRCYNGKLQKHIQIQREKIVVETKNVPETKASERAKSVPLVSSSYSLSEELKKSGEKILTRGEYEALDKMNCDRAEYAVFADGNRKGQKVVICKKTSKCPVHWKSYTSSLPKEEKPTDVLEVESLERKNRKEEIIDVNVGEIVRREILAQAAKTFDAEKTIFNHSNSENYLSRLINAIWKFQCNWSENDAKIIRQCLGVSSDRLETSYPGENGVARLTAAESSRLLWLLLHVPVAQLYENNSFKSQAEIKAIAEEFGLDYQMIDAVERLKYAHEKHEKYAKEFHNYLVKLENGDRTAEIPRVYSPDYKPKE